VWYVKPSAAPVVTRFRFGLPAGAKFTSVARHVLNISADGTKIVFVANNRLYVRKISEVEPQAIAASENIGSAVVAPAFSPDGRSIAFWSSGPEPSIKRLDIDGGVVMTLCPSDNPFGISWTDDGIVFTLAEKGEILRVSPTGGMPEVIAKSKAGEMISGPQLLPGGRDLLFSVTNETGPDRWDKGRIVVQRVGSTEQRTLIDGGSDARYLASGHLAYALAGVVFAVPFDLSRVALKGTAVPMVVGVRRSVPVAAGAAHFAVSRNGTLVYLPGPSTSLAQMLDLGLASRDGQVKLLDLPRGAYSHPRVSRDGRRIAFLVGSNREEFIAIYNLAGSGAMRRLTLAGNSRYPVWSGDGQRVVYQSDREGDQALYWQPADGSGAPERLTRPAAGEAHFPEHWSPTSNTLLFTIVKGAEHTVWTLTIPDRKIAPIAAIRSSIPINPVFSPDGQWIAYQSDQSGRSAVYVRSSSGAVYPLLPRGADQPHEPLWSPSGTELFYNPRASGFEVVSVTTEPEFAFGNPIGVNRPFNLAPPQARRSYDITPDGWFVALLAPSNETTDGGDFEVVTNWFQELRQRVP
jgi:serine/threonine-protein kinase